MTEPGYRILDHPSDAGIEARGKNLKEAFEFAARGMMSIIVDPESVGAKERKSMKATGTDPENLLVRWLSDILFQYDGNGFLVSDVEVREISANALTADLRGESLNPGKHKLRTDIKAVTYHQLKVEMTGEGCLVRVFFDL